MPGIVYSYLGFGVARYQSKVHDGVRLCEHAIKLQQGAPLVCGSAGRRKGIRIEDGIPTVVELADEEDPVARGIALHDEFYETPAYAFALASLQRPQFPLPIGVFRAVERATYDGMLEHQVSQAIEKRGAGDLRELLHSGDTWSVDA